MRALRSFAAGVAGAGLAMTAACGSTDTATSSESSGVTPIGYSALFLQDPAQAAMVSAWTAEAEQIGLEILSPTSANGDAGKQDSDIRNLVTAGAKSLFLIPADPRAVVPAVDYARGQGLKVVSLMLGPSGGQVDISLQVDNKDIGVQACHFLADKVGPDGTVLHIQGDMRAVTAQDRDEGFRGCMEEEYPGVNVIIKTGGQWDPPTAASSASAVLNSDPDLGGIFMASDGYVDPVAQVLSSRGRNNDGGDGHVWTVAVDGTPSALNAIREGRLDADAAQPVDLYVKHGLEYLLMLENGEEISLGETGHGSVVIETEEGYLADVFPAQMITKQNVDDPANWANGN